MEEIDLAAEDKKEIRFFIPNNIYGILKECITVKIGDSEVLTDTVNQFARECFYLGLRAYVDTPSLSQKVSSGDETAKTGVEESQETK